MRRQQALDLALDRLRGAMAIDIGTVVWERRPAEGDYEPRGGTVVDIRDGKVLCVQAGATKGKPYIHTVLLAVTDLDPALEVPPSPPRMSGLARHICASLGAKRGRWTPEELAWLDRAKDLVSGDVVVTPPTYSGRNQSPKEEPT